MRPDEITIAITVYSRSEYIFEAIQSALDQTVPVKVIVVEDCGPNPKLQETILARFGKRITYFRNPANRGLFDNWNACLEYCQTKWISILHDDDFLRPVFVETMIELEKKAPGAGIFFGRSATLENGRVLPLEAVSWEWREFSLAMFAELNWFYFAGQLFRAADALALGGFRKNSYFTGDWEMWFKLALRGGIVQSAREVAVMRSHHGADRGTSRVERRGWRWGLDYVQTKRNLHLLAKTQGVRLPFDRARLLQGNPVQISYLLRCAQGFSPRMLTYNYQLFVASPPPKKSYAAFQALVRCLGPGALRTFSKLWNHQRRAA